MSWDENTLESLLSEVIDYRGKTPKKSDYGVKLITAKIIKNGRILTDGNFEYIRPEIYDETMRRGIPQKDDVLITTEAPLGEVAIIRSDEKIALAQRVILLRANRMKLAPFFLYYSLQSQLIQSRIKAKATGTTVFGIKNPELRSIKVPTPSLDYQQKIASILSAYDDLIENNLQRIQLLEEAAQLIYKEWFVNLRFPGHEHTKIVDGVPEGWECGSLVNICSQEKRSIDINKVDPDTPYVGLEHIPRRSISLLQWGYARDIQSNKFQFEKGEILFGKIRPYFHKVVKAPISGICSSDAIVIRPKKTKYLPLVLSVVSSFEFVDFASKTSKKELTCHALTGMSWNNSP